MLDWLTLKINHVHKALPAGSVMAIDQDGNIEWETVKAMQSVGSYDSKVRIRSHGILERGGMASEFHFSGNPSKYLQGHNLWGNDDPLALMRATLDKITSGLGIASVRAQALASAQVSRLDFTKSLKFENRQQVRAYLQQVCMRAHSRSGRPAHKGTTLYFQEKSRRHQVVMYAKGDELDARGHHLPEQLPLRDKVYEEADTLLRVELRLFTKELEKIEMRRLCDCTPAALAAAYRDYIGRIRMTTAVKIADETLLTLGRAVGNTYLLHKAGIDVRPLLSESTYYRHRRELLRYGVDIHVPMPQEGSAEIIPLHRVIEARPYKPPVWAAEQGLFFQKTGS